MTAINNKLANLAIYGYILLLYMVVLLVTFAFWSVPTRAWWRENVTSFGIKRDCNWLDFDKVSLKLASKNLLHSKLKPRFKIFSVLLFLKKRISIWIAASGKYKKCSLLASCTHSTARKANFLSLLLLVKKSQCSHARECSQRPFVIIRSVSSPQAGTW